jgi:hypothetical protein
MLTPMRATELTNEQWEHVEPLLPPYQKRGHPRADDRKTLNGILYVLRMGCRWQDVPREAPLLPAGEGLKGGRRTVPRNVSGAAC